MVERLDELLLGRLVQRIEHARKLFIGNGVKHLAVGASRLHLVARQDPA